MSFPRYPAYKDSGVEWLGEVPEHWEVGQSRRRFALRNERALDGEEQLTASQKHGIIRQADFVESEGRRVVEVIKGADILKHVEVGDFVISMRSFQGGIEYSPRCGSISSAYVMLKPIKGVHPGFFRWLFKSSRYIQALQSTSNLVRDGQALRFSNFAQVDIPVIPLSEQASIAVFLDRETAKIDALIAEQQRLIELLQEKRQAVISHAVIKGLNPDAPMKDSGVEWLGEVPEHWEVTRYKRFCELQRGHDLTNDEREEGPYPVVTSSGINGFHSAFIAKAPGVVTGRYGSTGTAFFIEQDYWPHNTSLYIKDFHGNSARFSWYLLQAIDLKSLSAKSAVPGIDRNDVHELFVAFPQSKEQIEIATYLDAYCQKQSLLIREADSSVQLLQERRSALISAAVTGQIDVRGVVPETSAA
jgi:type I restriction enzyme S subunit